MKKHKLSMIFDFVEKYGPLRRKDIVDFICALNGYTGDNKRGYYADSFSGQKIFRYTKKSSNVYWKTGDLICPHKWDNRFLAKNDQGLYYVTKGTWVKGAQYTEWNDYHVVMR